MQRRSASFFALASAFSAGLLSAAGAHAQTLPALPAADAETGPEIVVTVQKRAQDIIDVPIAVTSFDQDFLDRVGVTKFDELALWTPGFEVQEQSPNNPAISLRGITTDSGEATSEPRVAIFQDGVSVSKSRGSYVELFDLERVEIAKGPQATLFGRGALIGGVNIIQAKPDLDGFAGNASLRLGDYETRGVNFMVNAPVVEGQLGVRVAGAYRTRDGFTENTLGGEALGGVSLTATRASVLWEPSPDFAVTFIANTQVDDNTGTAFKGITYNPPAGNVSPFTAAALNSSAPGFNVGRTAGLDRRVTSGTALVDWEVAPSFTLTAITGYREFRSLEVFDPDGAQNPILLAGEDAKGQQWSQEFRLSYADGGALSWFVGASWLQESGRQRVPTVWDERFTLGLVTGLLSRPNPQASLSNAQLSLGLQGLGLPSSTANLLAPRLKAEQIEESVNTAETNAIDLYGDVTYQLTPQWEVSAGLRWTRDDKSSRIEARTVNGGSILGSILALPSLPLATQSAVVTQIATTGTTPLPLGLFTQPTAPGGLRQAGEFDDFTWRLVARYEVSEDLSFWASYARGRRPDVISATPGNAPGSVARTAVAPAEQVDGFEVGVRGRSPDGALRYDASIYAYDYANFQTTAFSGLQLVTINAGNAKAIGFEGSLSWQIEDGVEVFGSYGYNRARFEGGARDGNAFRLSPDHTLAVGAQWTVSLGALGAIQVLPSYSWQSKVFFDDNNDRASLQPALFPSLADTAVDEFQDDYGLLNLRVTFQDGQDRFTLTAYGTNLLDEEYLLDAGNTGDTLGLPTFIRGGPAQVGVELKLNF
jgi:iron complex outermembrane recepter protein